MRSDAPVDIRELNARAVAVSVAVVSALQEGQLDLPTPCDGWSLRELLAHMTAQHLGFAAAAAGNGAGPAVWQVRPLGEDPAAMYADAAAQVVTAFAADGVLDREFMLPELSTQRGFPGAQAIGFHFIDYVVHAWDVAKTLGVPVEFDDGVLAHASVVARAVPDGAYRLTPGTPFKPALPARADASTLDQIVAWLGRSPGWPDASPSAP